MNEQLRLVIVMAGAWWKTPLEYGIYLNGECLERKNLEGKLLTNVRRTFGGKTVPGWNEIKIRLESKSPDDIYKDPATGEVLRNKYIDLKSIYINDFGAVGDELTRLGGCWYKDRDVVTPIKSCIIYEAGTFVFRFKSPISYWALENMRTDRT